MAAQKRLYVNGFNYGDISSDIFKYDGIGNASQMPSWDNPLYEPTDFVWWDPNNSPGPRSTGSAFFRGDCEIPTHTSTVTTTRVEHSLGTSNPNELQAADEIWQSISYYTPEDYENDPNYDVISQWHGGAMSPPVSIRRVNGRLTFDIWGQDGWISQQVMDVGPVVPGGWVHFVFYMKWRDNLEGQLTVWRDGKLARLHSPTGEPWVVPHQTSPGVTTNWIIKPAMGDLPYTVDEGGQEVSVLDWRGRISHIDGGIMPDKYFKCGIYKSSITRCYVPGNGLREGWDDPDSEYFIPEVSRITRIGVGNMNIETRVNEKTHMEIFKSLDVNGNEPLEFPEWWVDPEPINIVSPTDGSSIEVGQPISIITDVEEGEVELVVEDNLVDIKDESPYTFEISDIPRNDSVIDLPFNENSHQWGIGKSGVSIINPNDVSYEEAPRGQAIILGSEPVGDDRSYISIANTGLLSGIGAEFTISFYIKSGFGSGMNPYVLNAIDPVIGTGLGIWTISNGTMEARLYEEGESPVLFRISISAILDPDEFQHYILSYDGDTLKWYHNLILVNQLNSPDLNIPASKDWYINAFSNQGGRQKMSISDFRIYNYAIPEEEVQKTVEDNYLGQLELKIRRDGIISDPVTINIVEELPTFTITATATTGGQVSGDGEYEENEEVTLTATPDTGYDFVRWEEDSETVSTDNPYVFSAEGDRVLLAVFQQIEYQLTVTYTAGGTATGSGEYISGSQVQLTATPNSGYNFVGWYRDSEMISTSNPYNYTTRGQADTVQAVFELIPIPEFTITVIPSMGGSVSGGGTYEEGQSVTLSAMPQSGWTFVKWSNDATDNPYSFSASENLTISAIFEEVDPEVPYIIVKGKFKIV